MLEFSSAVLSTLSQYQQKYEKKKENGKKEKEITLHENPKLL